MLPIVGFAGFRIACVLANRVSGLDGVDPNVARVEE